MQCEVGITNSLCPTVQPTDSQVEGLTEEASGAASGDIPAATAEPESGIRSSNLVTNIQINNSSVAVGETTIIPVWVTVPDASGLTAVTLDITFNPAIVTFNNCTTNEAAFDLSLCALQGDGHTVSTTALSVSGFSGEAFLVQLSFTGLAQGSSHLEPSLRVFEDGSGHEARLRGGRLNVGRGSGNEVPEKEISALGKVVKTAVSAPKSQATDPNKGPEAVVPSTISIGSGVTAVGVPITVPLTIDVPPTNNLMAATLRIQYDPTTLTFDSCATNNDDFDFNLCNRSEGDGNPPDVISFSAISAFGVNGTLQLGTITFSGNSSGASSLVIVAETYNDGSGEAPVTIDGTVEVEAPTAVTMGQMSAAAMPTNHVSAVLLIFFLVLATTVVILLMRKIDRKFN
jgi:hypothetical protein